MHLILARKHAADKIKVQRFDIARANEMVARCFLWNTARSEAPSSKHQAPKKLQISSSERRSERCGGYPGRRVEVWSLELLWPVLRSSCTAASFPSVVSATEGGSLELGIWSFPAE